MNKKILLSFDVEEFDLPGEYKAEIGEKEKFEFSFKGLKKVVDLIDRKGIKATFFVTASFALKYPAAIKRISKHHEIASHGLSHSSWRYSESEAKKSKEIIEKIIKKKISGFRMSRLQKVDYDSLKRLGFSYDSSVAPSFIPGRYNYFFEKRRITLNSGVYLVPISVLPVLRLPFSWIFFRNFGVNYGKIITISSLKSPGFVNFYLHPWEFSSLSRFEIPGYIKRNSGEKIKNYLENYISWCRKKGFGFSTFSDYLGV
jgi:peptidoglycan/xylan/chitin deacetylase (PgdA/CDA1 family)